MIRWALLKLIALTGTSRDGLIVASFSVEESADSEMNHIDMRVAINGDEFHLQYANLFREVLFDVILEAAAIQRESARNPFPDNEEEE